MDFQCEYVPLAWYNSGSVVHKHEYLDRSLQSHTMEQPLRDMQRPRQSQIDESDIHPAFRTQKGAICDRPVIYATIRPSLPRLRMTSQPLSQPTIASPTSPLSPRSSISSRDRDSYTPSLPSLISDTSSIRSDDSLNSSTATISCSPRTLRRLSRRPRGMSLRELRQKQSEMDLQRVYTSSVEEYLSGDIFDGFRPWPDAIAELPC